MSVKDHLPIWIDSAAKLSAVCATASFLGSVVYDWAYLRELGLGFSDIPTSLADHVRSGLLWLPATIAIAFGALLFGLLTRRIEGWQTEDEIVASSPNPKRTRAFRRSAEILVAVVFYAIAGLYVLIGDRMPQQGWWIALIAIWSHFVWWIVEHPRSITRRAPAMVFLVWLVGVAFILVFFTGQNDARTRLRASVTSHAVTLKKTADSPVPVTLFRPFERGVLVKAPGESLVRFLLWDEIAGFTATYHEAEYVGPLCRWTNICEKIWPRSTTQPPG